MTTGQAVHAVFVDVLTRYLGAPWTWPRESDLVVDLVTSLRVRTQPPTVPTRLRLPPNLVDLGATVARDAPRIRTEVKPRAVLQPSGGDSEVSDAEEEAGVTKQGHRDRIDIAVFKTRTVETVLHANGARDVVLEVDPDDLEAILEVKLYPDWYRKKDSCLWFEDILKLHALPHVGFRGVILVDTSLPLKTAGMTYQSKRKDSLARTNQNMPQWPIPAAQFNVTSAGTTVSFEPVDAPDEQGFFFWGLGITTTSQWSPTFANGVVPMLDDSDVAVCCWRVTCA